MEFISTRFVAIGETMLEMAPVGDGLFRMSHAGDAFNTLAALNGDTAPGRYVTQIVGQVCPGIGERRPIRRLVHQNPRGVATCGVARS